ncbi:hypothetical protein SAMN05421659_10336 [[Clostridium] fimetarium]|uniref:Resolvase, N terminal domain n=2 Tax=[Clostridium] fimetarium TaxID=99656 RepID=A0A1I0NEL5_9FIRM|nr:hypothetical protein SAMN05421659_10336 [[Clostridium] fimetarium]
MVTPVTNLKLSTSAQSNSRIMKAQVINMILILIKERAFGFVKSRKSDLKVMDMGAQMYQFAEDNGLKLLDVIVDRKGSYDVDRPIINELMEGLESGRYSVILVRDINDITADKDEQKYFLMQVKRYGGEVVSIYDGSMKCNYDEC